MSLKEENYEIQIITSTQEMVKVQPEWEEFLTNNASSHNFWQHPKVMLLNIACKDAGEPLIIILRYNNQIVCIEPGIIERTNFYLTFSVFKIPGPRLRILKIQGSDFIFSKNVNINNCIEKILLPLKELRLVDLISLESLSNSSAFYNAFAEKKFRILDFKLLSTSPKTEKIRKHILKESYESWLATLRGKTRGKIRRRIRSLYKRYPEQIQFKKITTANQVPGYLHTLNELYPKTWQAKTFGLKERASKREMNFYQRISEKGWLRSYLLCISRKPVAFLVGFQHCGVFLHAECGYDPDFSNAGVGTVLNYLMLQDIYETNKPYELNFGFGENEYKKILGNEEYDAFDAWVSLPGRWRLLILMQRMVSSSEDKIRSLIIRLKLEKRIRKILKRK